jgi:hypothetical protein
MKVNSIGINAYRQAMDKPPVTDQKVSDQQKNVGKTDKVKVPVQANRAGSKLAVKLKSGTFTDMLSAEEKQALEMVFDRFREMAAYSRDGAPDKNIVGNFVDVKL